MISEILLFGPSILYILLTGYTVILDLTPGYLGLLHSNITVVQSVILCMGWLHGMSSISYSAYTSRYRREANS